MKHSFSSLPDLDFEAVEYDDASRVVTLRADAVDSSLVAPFVLRDLPDSGIIAYYDDPGGPRVPGARWQLAFSQAGVLWGASSRSTTDTATRMSVGGRETYGIEPVREESMVMSSFKVRPEIHQIYVLILTTPLVSY